jgi:TonB family protein
VPHAILVLVMLRLLTPQAHGSPPSFVATESVQVRSHVPMDYPEAAEATGVAGVVVLAVDVDAAGAVSGAVATGGHSRLVSAAEANVRRWTFAPGAPRRAAIVYDFQLGGPRCDRPPASVFVQRQNVATIVGCARPGRREPSEIDDGGVDVVRYAPPLYPPAGLSARRDGMVVFAATIDAAGDVADVTLLAGDTLLVEDLEENVRTWQFEPGGSARRVLVAYELSVEPGRCMSSGFASRFTFRQRNVVSIVLCERPPRPDV